MRELEREKAEGLFHPWKTALEETVQVMGAKLEQAEARLREALAAIRDADDQYWANELRNDQDEWRKRHAPIIALTAQGEGGKGKP